MLKKGLKGGKCSYLIDIMFGLVASSIIHFTSGISNTRFTELTKHSRNVIIRTDQFDSFLRSCASNYQARFEIVLSPEDCSFMKDVATGGASVQQSAIYRQFTEIEKRFFASGTPVISTGNWWITQRLPMITQIHEFLAGIVIKKIPVQKPLSVQQLFLINHLQDILYYATFGSYNQFVDLGNKNWLLEPVTIKNLLRSTSTWPLVKLSDCIKETQRLLDFGNGKSIQRFGYSCTFCRHAKFILQLAPETYQVSQYQNPFIAILQYVTVNYTI